MMRRRTRSRHRTATTPLEDGVDRQGRRKGRVGSAGVPLLVALAACGSEQTVKESAPGVSPGGEVQLAEGVDASALARRVEQFAPVTLTFDASLLDVRQKGVLKKLVEASDRLQRVFLRQVWRKNPALADALADATGPGAEPARRYYEIMAGPWDRLAEDEPFLAVGPKPPGAGYYPEDATKEEIEAWLDARPEDREAFTSYYTVIERTEDGGLRAVPYSEAYGEELAAAAGLLREAAELAENPSLKLFLETRADALLSNDYFESEVAWMRLKENLLDPTIGPYEVYEDNLFGYKAAFESFLAIRDPEESRKLAALVSHLPELERALPIPDEHKNLDRPFTSPISVVTEVYTAGDTRAGVQTLAFNLPNDPRVREQEGSKKVMLKNVVEAKFEKILRPIAGQVMDGGQAEEITFEPYFTRIVMHELAHGLGPDYVTGRPDLTVNKALQDRYSAIEEAKADVVGTHSLGVLGKRGVYDAEFVRQVHLSHAADLFRCVRFGVSEAHGKGCLMQFNYLVDRGALEYEPDGGTFRLEVERMSAAIATLAREFLLLEATGDYEATGAFLQRYGGEIPESLRAALDKLASVPVDIAPRYAVRELMSEW
ncbi:MAG: peptidase [Gemmatimonadota bacterium]